MLRRSINPPESLLEFLEPLEQPSELSEEELETNPTYQSAIEYISQKFGIALNEVEERVNKTLLKTSSFRRKVEGNYTALHRNGKWSCKEQKDGSTLLTIHHDKGIVYLRVEKTIVKKNAPLTEEVRKQISKATSQPFQGAMIEVPTIAVQFTSPNYILPQS